MFHCHSWEDLEAEGLENRGEMTAAAGHAKIGMAMSVSTTLSFILKINPVMSSAFPLAPLSPDVTILLVRMRELRNRNCKIET
jgi:hypothetical protein